MLRTLGSWRGSRGGFCGLRWHSISTHGGSGAVTSMLERIGDPDLSGAYRTVSLMVRERALATPDAVAMRDKNFGIWQERTWSEFWDEIVTAAHGLLSLGVERGDVISIHSEDRPEWVITDLAAIAIRAMSTGLYPTNPVSYTHLRAHETVLDLVCRL